MTQPDAATLNAWAARWHAIKLAAYIDLVASYTPEQHEIVARMNRATHQYRLCRDRARWPEGASGKHATLVRWPSEPPE